MKSTKNQNFKNKFLLSFKDDNTADLYYRSIYTFLKSFVISLLSYSSLVVNLILLYVYEVEASNKGIKNLQVFLLIIEGMIIISYVLWNKLKNRLKNENSFFWANLIVSMMNLFNIYLQPIITREALKIAGNSVGDCYLIPFAQNFLVVMYLFFVDNNFLIYLINFIVSFVLASALGIAQNWTENMFEFVLIFLGGILYSVFVYFVNRKEKNNFLLHREVVKDFQKKNSFVNNLNSGYITIDEDGYDYNLKILEYINPNFIGENDRNVNCNHEKSKIINEKSCVNNFESFCELNNNNKNINYELNTLLFDNYREFNPTLDKNLKNLFKSREKFSVCGDNDEKEIKNKKIIPDLLNLMRSNDIYQSYVHIGDKVINKSTGLTNINQNSSNLLKDNSKTLRVYLRYNIVSSSLEFFLYDISSVIEVENLKASFKYKKLFLNKFSHEFKNPLLNIVELVSDLKRKIIDSSVNHCSQNYSPKINTISNKTVTKEMKYSTIKGLNLPTTEIRLEGFENLNEIKHIKNSSMHLIALIDNFDFISNSDMTLPSKGKNDNIKNKDLKLPKEEFFIEISRFRLIKIIKQCVNILQSKIELSDKNIKILCLMDENIPVEIYTDYRRLKQVISNLLSNAFKFTSMGEISITVKKDALNENLINFEICDTGVGFREDILKLIQEGKTHMLFGNINSGSNIYGCGIGLELVEKIISQIGVNLKISSKIDEGSTVTFSIYNKIDLTTNELGNSNINSPRSIMNANETANNVEFSPRSILKNPNLKRSMSCRNDSFKSLFFNYQAPLKESEPEDEIKFKSVIKKIENNNNNNISPLNLHKDNKELELKLENENFSLRNNESYSKEYKIKIINCDSNLNNANDNNSIVNEVDEGDDDDDDAKTIVINQMMRLHSHYYPCEKVSNTELESDSVVRQNPVNYSIIQKRESNESYQIDGDNKNEQPISARSKQDGTKLDPNTRRDGIKSIKILLVDDEKFIRQSESNQIKKYFASKPNSQYEITECSDGVECLYEIFKGIKHGIKYDYVITDESMNFMTGSSMIKYLNTLNEDKIMYGIKKFMVTSYEPWAIINTHGHICDGIISKPLSFESLTKIFSI